MVSQTSTTLEQDETLKETLTIKETEEYNTAPKIRCETGAYRETGQTIFFPSSRYTSIPTSHVHFKIVLDPASRLWLPPKATKLIDELTRNPLSEKQIMTLMNLLAQRVIDHFQFEKGKCLAISFDGNLVETADTKIELLMKIQGSPYSNRIFVWEVGSPSFSGWR